MLKINRRTETRHDNTWVVYTNAETGEVLAELIVPTIK